ncbi:MAG: DinB family protein, partial [Thermoplasmata archaeon]
REISALFEESARHPTNWKEFRRYSDRVWAGVEATLSKLTTRDLGRRVRAPWFPRGRYTVGDAFLQTTLEEAHHLGEIIGALWQDDRASPPMTWLEVSRMPRRRSRVAR